MRTGKVVGDLRREDVDKNYLVKLITGLE